MADRLLVKHSVPVMMALRALMYRLEEGGYLDHAVENPGIGQSLGLYTLCKRDRTGRGNPAWVLGQLHAMCTKWPKSEEIAAEIST